MTIIYLLLNSNIASSMDFIFKYRLSYILIATVTFIRCQELSSFSTAEDEIYRGKILKPEEVRKGFSEQTNIQLYLKLPPENGTGGWITVKSTIETEEGKKQYLIFNESPLRQIPSLQYDALSNFNFPTGRLKNYMFMADGITYNEKEFEAICIISLMADGKVEARIISGVDRFYGIFILEKEKK